MSASSTPGNETVTSSASAETQSSVSAPGDMAIGLYAPQGSNGKPRGIKGKNGTSSTPSIESETPVLPSEDMSVVPHDPEGTDGQTERKKGKKRGRHFDREVRAHILQV